MGYALFGAGKLGKKYFELLKDEYNIVFFIDNDPKKQGQQFSTRDVLAPESAIKMDFDIIITSAFHLEIAQQLFELGVKEFFIPENDRSSVLSHIDLSHYDDLSEIPNKICLLRREYSGAVSATLIKNNSYDDVQVFGINSAKRDSEYFYHYLTCSLIITQFAERVHNNKKSIELWHAFPTKTLGYLIKEDIDRAYTNTHHENFMKKDAICSLSMINSIFLGYCFNIEYNKFHITGYPRNDMLFCTDSRNKLEKIIGKIRQKYIIIYMPTYREHSYRFFKNGENTFIPNMPDFDEIDFNVFLKRNDILFLHKMHSVQKDGAAFSDTNNVMQLTDTMLDEQQIDLYEVLNATDCLISDYSSVIIDYLLTGKPIIHTPTDLETYEETRGIMMAPYDAWATGEVVLDYANLKNAIGDALWGEDKYERDREKIRKITHKYNDNKSTERVLKLAREILKTGKI